MDEFLAYELSETITSEREVINPFPGLRAFGLEESHLFFGREGQSEEVLEKLAQNRFVAVIGASGSGKSSLMYCGITPALHGGFLTGPGNRWKMVVSRPGRTPVYNLAVGLVQCYQKYKKSSESAYFDEAITASILNSSSLGLIEAIRHLHIADNDHVLIMVDQFEELFRFKNSQISSNVYNETHAFIKLLMHAITQHELPIYVILTMRSDFISECAQFQELTRLINDSHYLIPQMSREGYQKAIVGPVAVGTGQITQRLVHRLLNDVGDNADTLPILQHALMRTWDYWIYHRQQNEPMDIIHYEAIGGLEKALSEHANEAYDELDDRGRFVCEKVFKALTETGIDKRGIRRPCSVEELSQIIGASVNEIIFVVNKFRIKGRSFLTPAAEIAIHEGSVIDISHESLMRIWDRLIVWVDEEAMAVKMYTRLVEASENFHLGKTGLWRPPDLQIALDWKKKQQPTLAWAQRHHPAFERAMVFLKTSEKDYVAEEQNKIKLQKRTLRRTRTFALVLGIAAILSLGFMLYAIDAQVKSEKSEGLAKIERVKAYRQKLISDMNALIAEAQSRKAIENERQANLERSKAIIQTLRADLNARIAFIESKNANNQRIIAEEQKNKAVKNSEIAEIQRNKANDASRRADTLRILSIAQSMAVKSLQINRDTALKALVAYQAYLFNRDYKGIQNNPDIYSALYFSNKLFDKKSEFYIKNHASPVRALMVHKSKNIFYSSGSDKKIHVWDGETNTIKDTLWNVINDVNACMTLNQGGRFFATGTLGSYIQIFDNQTEKKKPEYVFNCKSGAIKNLIFTRENYLLIVASNDKLLISDFQRDSIITKKISLTYKGVNSLTLSPDNRYLAGALENGSVVLWNMIDIYSHPGDTLQLIESKKIANSNIPVQTIAYSPNGKYLAYGDKNGLVYFVNLNSNEVITLSGQIARISDIKFSNDSKMLASSSFDGQVLMWEIKSINNAPIIFRDNKTWVFSIDFTNDNKYLIAGYKDGGIQRWPTDIKILADKVRPNLERNLSLKEWDRYVADDIIPTKIVDRPFDEDILERIEELSNNQ